MSIPVLGMVENLSSFICPNCAVRHPLFGERGGKQLA
ncbi:MAG: P-loop NTPase [Promethearchaeota archaeon]